MESILSMHDEVYPLKSRRRKSTTTYPYRKSNSLNNNQTNICSVIYQYIKTIIIQRSIYILGILNLILAGIAILCVTQAEDHPEYFSLVYIAVSIFIFYMATIIFIIIVQIIEAYQERNRLSHSSLLIQIPLSTPQTNSIIVESAPTQTQPKTRLIRSHTLPKLKHHFAVSTSTFKDFNQSTHVKLLPKYQQTFLNLPNNYQSFSLTTNNHLCPSCTRIINNDSDPHLSPLIKPIPLEYHVNKPKIQFIGY